MAVTIKRSTLKLKTAKTVSVGEPAGGVAVPGRPTISTAPIPAKGPSYTAYGIMGILSVLIVIGLLVIQWIEYSENTKSGLFPTPETMAAAATRPGVSVSSGASDI